MPLYGFNCRKCGHDFETLVRSSDVPSCPSCGSTKLERQLSLIAKPAKNNGGDAPVCNGMGGCGMSCPALCD
jgi:putative FmdB family regulatory protein